MLRIRDPVIFFTPGSGISGIRDGKETESGSGMNIPDPESLETVFRVKY
jgi:hypothetical protein